MDKSNRYMMRGVSAAKEDVHNAIESSEKGREHGLAGRVVLRVWEAPPTAAASCRPRALAQSRLLHTFIGKKLATLVFGRVWHKMPSL